MKTKNAVKKSASRSVIRGSFNKTTELNFKGLEGRIEIPKRVTIKKVAGLTTRERSLAVENTKLERGNKEIVQLIQKIEKESYCLEKANADMKKLLKLSWNSVHPLLDEKLKKEVQPLFDKLRAGKGNVVVEVGNAELKDRLVKKSVEASNLSAKLEEAVNEKKAIINYLNYMQRERTEMGVEESENVGSDGDEKETIDCKWESSCTQGSSKHWAVPDFIKSCVIGNKL